MSVTAAFSNVRWLAERRTNYFRILISDCAHITTSFSARSLELSSFYPIYYVSSSASLSYERTWLLPGRVLFALQVALVHDPRVELRLLSDTSIDAMILLLHPLLLPVPTFVVELTKSCALRLDHDSHRIKLIIFIIVLDPKPKSKPMASSPLIKIL